MNKNDLKTLFDYHYWANQRVWQCVLKLSHEQFLENIDYSRGSIRNHSAHCLQVERMWFDVARDTLNDDIETKYGNSHYMSRAEIESDWAILQAELYAYLDSVSDEQLNAIVTYEFPWCGEQSHPRWQCLMYIITHMIDHRAQMLAGLHRLGAETVMQDFIRFVWKMD